MGILFESEFLLASVSSIGLIISFGVGSYIAFKETIDLHCRRKAAKIIYNEKLQKIMGEARQIALQQIKTRSITKKGNLDEINEDSEPHPESKNDLAVA